MRKTAIISPCQRYRYRLTRFLEPFPAPELLAIMLNPSTADASVDDPTIRRLMGFARLAGYGELIVMNLYALRSTDPDGLKAHDAVGMDNDWRLEDDIARQRRHDEPVLAAWGSSKWAHARAREVMGLVSDVRWLCLGTTKDGSPRHPLYVKASQPMIEFKPR